MDLSDSGSDNEDGVRRRYFSHYCKPASMRRMSRRSDSDGDVLVIMIKTTLPQSLYHTALP
jgi:hypothetical protein